MPLDAFSDPSQTGAGAMRRVGTLDIRTWRAKVYAPALLADGLRAEDLAAAKRACRAGVADPFKAPTCRRSQSSGLVLANSADSCSD